MNKNHGVSGKSVLASTDMRRLGLARLLIPAALLCLVASVQADQLQVTGANFSGNAIYDLGISPSSTTPIKPVIASTTTPINIPADQSTHVGIDALVWVPNPVCKSLDLIAADAAKGQIVRYVGASAIVNAQAGCYNPPNAVPPNVTPSVNPMAQILFKWTKAGSGPAFPNGVSVDASGNLFVVSSVGGFDSKPSVWVLPFNASPGLYCGPVAGVYCQPVLIDNKFGGTYTLALAETLVAGTAAVTSSHTVLWKEGDLLVLVGDSFDARLLVYSQSKLYNSSGQLARSGLPLNGPTATPIPWAKFLGELAAPFGMDLWPANATPGSNASVLFTTIDGRILTFDTVQNKFISDFADRLGPGLQKIKVGSYSNVPYAFVAQLEARNTGQILVFGPPPASGPNKPLAAVSKNVMSPVGLAVSYTGSQSLPTAPHGTTPCAKPNAPCVVAPLGPELVSTITAYPGDNISGTVVEQNCIVQADPRVTGSGASWSCNGNALPIGANTSICPSFPPAVIPGSVCGHSGLSGAGFAVIEGTATGIDPNLNNSFIVTAGNIDAVLPGATNLECSQFVTGQIPGQIPLMAWGTRSDLPTVEGTIPEDSQFGSPLGGLPGYLTELTASCDTSTSGHRELSIFAIGLGLSYTDQSGVYTLQNQKYEALQQTISTAAIATSVQTSLAANITTAENYVYAAQSAGYPSTSFNNNINCALYEIVMTDNMVRSTPSAFSSNLIPTGAGGGNENPAGDIDGRLANWYTTLNTMLAGNAPYPSWPLMPPYPLPTCPTQGPYTLSATITGYTPGIGLQAYNVVNGDTIVADNFTFDASGNATISFQIPFHDGDRYGIQLAEPSTGEVCTVTSGDTGVVIGGTPPNVFIACSTNLQPTIGVLGTVPFSLYEPNSFYFSSVYTNTCVITSIDLWADPHDGFVEIYPYSTGIGSVLYAAPLPAGPPSYGTDTETITCYQFGDEGDAAAYSGPQIISNPGLPAPTLTITSFSYDSNAYDDSENPNPNFGNLSWTTSGSPNGGANTTCAIMSEFSGDGDATPLAQNPVLGLPANSAAMYPSGLPYSTFSNPYPICHAARQFYLYPDNMTLTCSDPTAGTAVMPLAVDLSAGCLSE